MTENVDRRKDALSIILVIFLVIIGVSLWFINQITQQRAFAFLVSAELVAFATLCYIYTKPFDELSKTWLLVAGIAVIELLILSTAAVG